MSNEKIEEKLTNALDTMVEFYLKKLAKKELSAAEQKNLIQLLRDNKITIDPKFQDPLESIANGDLDGIDWSQYVE